MGERSRRARYLALVLPAFSLASAIHTGCGGSTDSATHTGYGDGGKPSSSGTSNSKCTNIGSCGPSSDNCNCGTSCIHTNEGTYSCGTSCSTAADCKDATNPTTGAALTGCTGPHTGPLDESYDGICY